MDDKKIREGLLRDSEQVFEAFFHSLYEELCCYAVRFLSDRGEIEEVVQNCFVKLWEKRAEVETIKSFRAYMFRSVSNACLNALEHKKVKKQYAEDAGFKLKAYYAKSIPGDVSDDLRTQLMEAIERLPEKNKEVFKLRFIEGYNTKEVGEKLSISPRTVETHVSKTLKILRKMFSTKPEAMVWLMILILQSALYSLNKLSMF